MTPPRWADRFLEWYCDPQLLEEIQGDAHELYLRHLNEYSKGRADLLYVWNVLRFMRWSNIKRSKGKHTNHSTAMFKNYLRIGFRNALRNRTTTLINTFGLALGVAGALTIFIYMDQFYHTDDFHENKDRIYEVTNVIERNSQKIIVSEVPHLLGEVMQQEIPAIDKAVTIKMGGGAFRYKENVFQESIYFVDTTFFDVFTYPFIEGNKNVFLSTDNIVLTKKLARKYFGEKSALGENVSVKFTNDRVQEFTVGAVIDPPANNTMYFDMLMPMHVMDKLNDKNYDWRDMADGAFIMLQPGQQISTVSEMMGKYINLQHESFPEWKTDSFKFYALPTLSTRSYEIENGLIGSGHPQGPMVMLIISFMLLMLACINYMNISVATISTRLKEIGIRKVMGSAKKDIVQQFIIENMLLSTFAIALGVLISYLFFLPWLITLLGYEVPFAFSSGKTMVLFFIGLFLSIILISGIYPAIYVSGFQPVTILKGKEKFGQRSLFSRILLTIQFTLAFITIVGCLVFLDNGFYMKNRDWGYDHFRNMLVPVNSYEQYVKVKDKVASRSEIESFAGAKSHIGYQNPHSFVDHEGERFEIIHYQVGFDYVETMNLRMSEGRSFDENLQTDQETSVLINEKFARSMGWVYPINQTFYLDSVKRTVVGVVKDFHCKDFYNDILPVVLAVAPETEHRFITLRARNNKLPEIEQWMEVSWKKIAPDDPYRGKVQHEVFSNLYRNIQTETKLLGFITFITLVLACLGLYGLVSYNITRRLKEFSVRKIFGARLIQIFTLMNRDFVWILSVSFVLGAPAGFFLMDNLVHHVYVYPQDTTVFPFLLSIILMGLIVFITVGIQLHRIIHENPAQTLRNE